MNEAVLLMLGLALSGSDPVVVVQITAVGVDPAAVEDLAARIDGELQEVGATAARRELAEGCVEDPACLADASAGAAGVLVVDAVRFGPDLTLTLRLFNPEGAATGEVSKSMSSEAATEASLLAGGLKEPLQALLQSAARAAPAPAAEATVSSEKAELPVLPIALLASGGAVAALGAVVGLGGAAAFLVAQNTVNTATSSGDQKATAVMIGWASVGGVALSGVAVIAGLALLGGGGALYAL